MSDIKAEGTDTEDTTGDALGADELDNVSGGKGMPEARHNDIHTMVNKQ